MGQRLSAKRNVSDTSISINAAKKSPEDVSLHGRDPMPFIPAFAEPETNADQEISLSSDPETSRSEINTRTETSLVESSPKSLQHLPTELLMNIGSSLPPSNVMALTYTCRRVHHNMNVSIEQILGEIPARLLSARDDLLDTARKHLRFLEPHQHTLRHRWALLPRKHPAVEEPSFLRSERLNFLCMLERDQQIRPSRAVCSACVTTHCTSLFSPDSLSQHSDERECLGRNGRMWICPHWLSDYDEVRSSIHHREGHICRITTASPNPYVTSGIEGPVIIWPLIKLGNSQVPSRSQVAEALRPLTLSLCPHLRINDPFVLRHYSPDCEEMHSSTRPLSFSSFCKCDVCLWRRRDCSSCGASIKFHIMEDYDGNRGLKVIVERKCFQIKGVTDPVWIKQLAYPPEFEGLEQAWNASARRSEQALVLGSE